MRNNLCKKQQIPKYMIKCHKTEVCKYNEYKHWELEQYNIKMHCPTQPYKWRHNE